MNTKNKAILVISVFAAFLLVAIPSVQASPGDIEVNETGWWWAGDPSTFNASDTPIQHAIDNATADDTIFVHSGTYYENIVIDKSLTLQGEDKATTTIQSVLEGGMYGTYGDRVVIIEASDVTVSGFTISGYTGTEEKTGSTAWGVYADGDYTNIEASDNIFTFYTQGGIRFLDVSDSLIKENIFEKDTRQVWYDPPGVVPGSYVDRTYGGAGPELWGCSGIDVLRNSIEEANIGVFIMGSSDTTIQDNIISAGSLADAGVHIQSATNTEINGNTISNFENGPKSGYNHGMKGAGIYVISDDVTIENNNIKENSVGIYSFAREGYPSSTGIVAQNNNIEGNSDYGVYNGKYPSSGSWNYWDYDKFLPADAIIDATNNWWGSGYGPEDATGETECLAPSEGGWNCDACDKNTEPVGLLGDKVSDNVDYCPWLDLWADLNKELAELIEKVDAADIRPGFKQSLIEKLEDAKTFKELAKEAHENGNTGLSKRYLRMSRTEVESFENRVKISGISQEYKDSFLSESAKIKAKIDRLIGKL